ncbi:N-acetyl-alpha-D-glucosaminyl L-malate synthase BshA [Chloroflexota bacterium]
MRIGIMCLASFGGSARIATQLAGQLVRRGYRVHLFARTTPFGKQDQADGVVLHTVTSDREADIHPARLYTDWSDEDFQAFLGNIMNVIAMEGLDILHFHYAVPFAYLAAEVKRRLGWAAPLVIGTLHGTDVSIYGRDPIKGPRLARALCEIDKITTVSDSHACLAQDVFGLPTRPEVIPNFVDLSKFQPSAPHLHAAGNTDKERHRARPKIAHVSNFRPVKDPESMAKIFLGIRERMDAELWLIGDGPEMDAVKSILGGSRFEKDVRYCSLRRDVARLLAQTDLLLMTSLSESFCLAALEAMACGVPVLATEVGGLPEVVIQGVTGYLFPVGDHDLAIRQAVNLLSDQTRHRAMGKVSVRHAACFGYERIVPAYEDLYQNLLVRDSDIIQFPISVGVEGSYAQG